jgi:hypothetical protein
VEEQQEKVSANQRDWVDTFEKLSHPNVVLSGLLKQ